MALLFFLIGLASAQFFGGLGGAGMGYGSMGASSMGYGGMGYGGMGYSGMSYGGMGMGGMGMGAMGGVGAMGGMSWLSGDELSEDELDELCCSGCCSSEGCCSPEGCCYELCGYGNDCGCGSCGGYGGMGGGFGLPFGGMGMGMGMGNQGFSGLGYGFPGMCDSGCGNMGFGGFGGMGYGRGAEYQDGRLSGYGTGRCANCYGAGNRNLGYNTANICGSGGMARLNAGANRNAGERAYSQRCADEVMIRRANEGAMSGRDCYDQSNANLYASGGRIAGNRACGNANSCYNNAAGLNSNSNGICGSTGSGMYSSYGGMSPMGC